MPSSLARLGGERVVGLVPTEELVKADQEITIIN